MKIAIISDTHDNVANLLRFLSWAKSDDIGMIIHCGDIASGETIDALAGGFNGPVRLAYGNMDEPRQDQIERAIKMHKHLEISSGHGELQIDRIKIAYCHFPNAAKALAESGRYHLVFFGHTHKPSLETLANKSQLINPGTLGGVFNKATFAIFDTATKNLELKVLELI